MKSLKEMATTVKETAIVRYMGIYINISYTWVRGIKGSY